MYKTIKMFLIFVCITLPLIISGDNFDPDIDICQNTVIDGSVFADDGNTYIFKGKYFWQMNSLDTKTGNIGFATLTSTKWPEVSGQVKAVFTTKHPNKEGLVTVFAVNSKWFAYQKGFKVMDGSISDWPAFNELKVTATFERVRTYSIVMALHSDNKKYSIFDFTALTNPKNMGTFDTWTRRNTVFFLDNNYTVLSKSNFGGIDFLDKLINVSAAITYSRHIVFIASDKYCRIDLIHKQYEGQCKTQSSTSKLIGCPFNIAKRPSTPVPIVPIFNQGASQERKPEGSNTTDINLIPGAQTNGTAPTLIENTPIVYTIIVTVICIIIVVMIIIVIISKILLKNKRSKGTVSFNK